MGYETYGGGSIQYTGTPIVDKDLKDKKGKKINKKEHGFRVIEIKIYKYNRTKDHHIQETETKRSSNEST